MMNSHTVSVIVVLKNPKKTRVIHEYIIIIINDVPFLFNDLDAFTFHNVISYIDKRMKALKLKR